MRGEIRLRPRLATPVFMRHNAAIGQGE